MAIPATNAFLEATPRHGHLINKGVHALHMHLKIISAQTGGLYIVSKLRNLQFTDSALA